METLSITKAKSLAQLLHKKYRKKRKSFLAEGVRLCEDLLNSEREIYSLVFTPALLKHEKGQLLLDKADKKNIPLLKTDDKTLRTITDTCNPQPIVICAQAYCDNLTFEFEAGNKILVLVDVSDPGNVGTLARTARAFGWDSIICVGNTAEIYSPKVVRASMGAIFKMKLACSNLETMVSFFEYTHVPYFITLPKKGILPQKKNLPSQYALLLGSEAHGLPSSLEKKANLALKLPMNQDTESLNVAVAGSIFLYLLGNYS